MRPLRNFEDFLREGVVRRQRLDEPRAYALSVLKFLKEIYSRLKKS